MISGKETRKHDVSRFLELLIDEFNLYPRGLLKQTRITKIILTSHLTFNNQKRKAIPDLGSNIMYFDVQVLFHYFFIHFILFYLILNNCFF